MMPEISVDEVLGVVRRVATYMTPTPADTTALRVAKEAFRLSALVMVASVATAVVVSPERKLALS